MTSERETAYLNSVLAMKPAEQAQEILNARRGYLNGAPAWLEVVEDHEDYSEIHDRFARRLNRLRNQFWGLTAEECARVLGELNVQRFPDLAVALARLKSVFDRRDSFRRLKDHPDCFPEFFDGFCRLVLAPPRKAIGMRVELLARARRNPKARIKPEYIRIATVIKQDFRELLALEEHWLDELIANRRSAAQSGDVTGGYKILWYALWIAAIIVIRVVARIWQ